jgi:hypothetical protein
VVFQYTYNGNVIEEEIHDVTVEFFQTADKERGVTVSSTYAGSDLYKPASGEATVYFNSEQVVVPSKWRDTPAITTTITMTMSPQPRTRTGREDIPWAFRPRAA